MARGALLPGYVDVNQPCHFPAGWRLTWYVCIRTSRRSASTWASRRAIAGGLPMCTRLDLYSSFFSTQSCLDFLWSLSISLSIFFAVGADWFCPSPLLSSLVSSRLLFLLWLVLSCLSVMSCHVMVVGRSVRVLSVCLVWSGLVWLMI